MDGVLKKLPGVLSFQRGMILGDGLFFNRYSNGGTDPLFVIRHGIRGTQNINKKGSSAEGATAASSPCQAVSNIQQTDSAKLAPEAVGLQVRFDFRVIDLKDSLFACAPSKDDKQDDLEFLRESISSFISRARESQGLFDVCCRYARNIANGRYLWRNRVIARDVQVRVIIPGSHQITFDALSIPLHDFSAFSDDEKRLATVIRDGFNGDLRAKVSVCADVDFGVDGPVEVFPSQNYLHKEEGSGFARPLYCVGTPRSDQDPHSIRELGQAALRDQKIGNALRTIDTWYPSFGVHRRAIPVEPNGANLDAQQFFREKESSGFNLMLKMGQLDVNSDDGKFLLACIIRGGVFSGSDK